MKLKKGHPLAHGLICSLLFDEQGGNILYDSTGQLNHGTGTSHSFGRDGIIMAGENEHITIPNFIGQNDDWTIFTQFTQNTRNPTSQSSNTVIAAMQNGTGSTGRTLLFINDVHTPTYKLASYIDGSNNYADTVININQAYSCGLTQIGTSFHFYLDGNDDGSFVATADSSDGDIVLFDHKFVIGTGCLDGSSKVFHWYNRGLSAEEMMWLDRDPTSMFQPEFIPHLIPGIVSYNVSVSLSQVSEMVNSSSAAASSITELANSLITTDGGGANTAAPTTLSNVLTETDTGIAAAAATNTLSGTLSVLHAASGAAIGTNTQQISMAITELGNAASLDSVSLTSLLFSVDGSIGILSDADFNVICSLVISGVVNAASGVSLSNVHTDSESSMATSESVVTLSDILSIVDSGGAVTQVDDELQIDAGIQPAATYETTQQITLNNIQSCTSLAQSLSAAGIILDSIEYCVTDRTYRVHVITPDERTYTVIVESRTLAVSP